MAKRVVLAYSGGLDTSVAVRWLREELGRRGHRRRRRRRPGRRLRGVRAAGPSARVRSSRCHRRPRRDGEDFVVPAIAANARYEGNYPLVSALSRPVIVRHLVAEARRHGADAVAHGCTGKGNDQVRFEVGTRALAPDLEILAPARTWGMTREDCVDYAARYDIPIEATKEKIYSIDENLWGRAIECGVHRGSLGARRRRPLHPHPSRPTPSRVELVIGFEGGVPVALDGRPLALVELIAEVGVDRRVVRLGPDRHGGEPPGRDQEPRDLRMPGRAGARCSPTPTSRASPWSATWPTRRRGSNRGGRSSSTTGCGSRRSRRPSTPSSPTPSATSPVRFGSRWRPGTCMVTGRRSPVVALRPRPRHLRRGGHLQPRATPRVSCGSGDWAWPRGRPPGWRVAERRCGRR